MSIDDARTAILDEPARDPDLPGADAHLEAVDFVAARVTPGTSPVEIERLAREYAQQPHSDPLATQVMLWILRAANAILSAQAEALRAVELSTSAFNVLMALRNSEDQTLEPCDIADRLLVTRPSVTGLLDTLQNKGLVERRGHPDDRRRRLIRLTPAARELLREHVSTHYAEMQRLFADLSDSDRRQVVALLRRVDGATPASLSDASDPALGMLTGPD